MSNGCVTYNIKLLNQIPPDDGISKTLSPSTLITGLPNMDYEELMKLEFGVYAQVHQENNIINTNQPRSVGAIALYPSGNAQKTWYFMSLTTGKRLHRRNWTILPMGQEIIEQVHKLADTEGRKNIVNNLSFEWRPGENMNDVIEQGSGTGNTQTEDNNINNEDEVNDHIEESMSDTEESSQDDTDELHTVNNDMRKEQNSDVHTKQSVTYSENDDNTTEEIEEQTYEFDDISQPGENAEASRTEVTDMISTKENAEASSEQSTRENAEASNEQKHRRTCQ